MSIICMNASSLNQELEGKIVSFCLYIGKPSQNRDESETFFR